MIDKPQLVPADKDTQNENPASSTSTIVNEADNRLAIAMASAHTDSTVSSCTSMEIDDSRATFKLDNGGRPSEIAFKPGFDGDAPTILDNIKYKGVSNEVSSLTTHYKHPVTGDMRLKYEQSADGSWKCLQQDKKGNWLPSPNLLTGRTQCDLGKITIATDSKTGKVEVHATGLEAKNIGEFVTDDGFMSENALKKHDPLSEKMCAFQIMEELAKTFEGKLSRTKLEELLAKEQADAPSIETVSGYERLISDFNKLAKGKNEIEESELRKCADEVRNDAIATAIGSVMANGKDVSLADQMLVEKIFDKGGPFLLLKSDDAKTVQEGVNRQLKSLGLAGANYSVKFGNNLVDRVQTGGAEFGFASAPKDRILEILDHGKPIGQVRIFTRTDLIE